MDTQLTAVIALKDQLSGGLNSVSKSLNGITRDFADLQRLANIALFAIKAALVLMGKEAVESAMYITKLSRVTGIGTQELQKIGAAATATGANFDRLSTGMKLLAEKAEKAAEGNRGFMDLFDKVGISVTDTNGNIKNASTLFNEFADVIGRTSNYTERMALAVEFLGRSGEELLPMLTRGSAGIKQFGEVAERAGAIMSRDTVVNLDILGKQMAALKDIAINMTGEWLASTGITIPKIISFYVDFSSILNQIVAGIKILWQGFLLFLEKGFIAISVFVNQSINQMKVALAQFVAIFGPSIISLTNALFQMGKISSESATNVYNALTKMAQGAKGLDANQAALIPDLIAEGWQKAEQQTLEKTQQIGKETDQLVEDLKARGSAVQDYMKVISDTNKNYATTTAGTLENMYQKMHTFQGGFQLAAKEFVRDAGNWKEAWLELFNSIENGISSALTKFAMEGGKLKDVMKDIFKSIEQSFISMITKMIAQKALVGLLGFLGFGGGEGGGMAGGGGGGGGSPQSAVAGPAALAALSSASGLSGNPFAMPAGANGESGGTPLGIAGDNSSYALASLAGLGFGASTAYEGVKSGNVTHAVVGGLVGGAALGTMILPGIGTAIGAVVGGLAGFFTGNAAKNRLKKQQEEAQAAQRAQEQALRDQARILIAADIRAKYGGGLADISAVTDIGKMLSGGITDETLDKLGAQNVVAQGNEIGTGVNSIQVGSPNIVVNATISGSYDVQRLAEDLGLHLASGIRVAVAGAGI